MEMINVHAALPFTAGNAEMRPDSSPPMDQRVPGFGPNGQDGVQSSRRRRSMEDYAQYSRPTHRFRRLSLPDGSLEDGTDGFSGGGQVYMSHDRRRLLGTFSSDGLSHEPSSSEEAAYGASPERRIRRIGRAHRVGSFAGRSPWGQSSQEGESADRTAVPDAGVDSSRQSPVAEVHVVPNTAQTSPPLVRTLLPVPDPAELALPPVIPMRMRGGGRQEGRRGLSIEYCDDGEVPIFEGSSGNSPPLVIIVPAAAQNAPEVADGGARTPTNAAERRLMYRQALQAAGASPGRNPILRVGTGPISGSGDGEGQPAHVVPSREKSINGRDQVAIIPLPAALTEHKEAEAAAVTVDDSCRTQVLSPGKGGEVGSGDGSGLSSQPGKGVEAGPPGRGVYRRGVFGFLQRHKSISSRELAPATVSEGERRRSKDVSTSGGTYAMGISTGAWVAQDVGEGDREVEGRLAEDTEAKNDTTLGSVQDGGSLDAGAGSCYPLYDYPGYSSGYPTRGSDGVIGSRNGMSESTSGDVVPAPPSRSPWISGLPPRPPAKSTTKGSVPPLFELLTSRGRAEKVKPLSQGASMPAVPVSGGEEAVLPAGFAEFMANPSAGLSGMLNQAATALNIELFLPRGATQGGVGVGNDVARLSASESQQSNSFQAPKSGGWAPPSLGAANPLAVSPRSVTVSVEAAAPGRQIRDGKGGGGGVGFVRWDKGSQVAVVEESQNKRRRRRRHEEEEVEEEDEEEVKGAHMPREEVVGLAREGGGGRVSFEDFPLLSPVSDHEGAGHQPPPKPLSRVGGVVATLPLVSSPPTAAQAATGGMAPQVPPNATLDLTRTRCVGEGEGAGADGEGPGEGGEGKQAMVGGVNWWKPAKGQWRVIGDLGGGVAVARDLSKGVVFSVREYGRADVEGGEMLSSVDLEKKMKEVEWRAEVLRQIRHVNALQCLGGDASPQGCSVQWEHSYARPITAQLRECGPMPGNTIAHCIRQILQGLSAFHIHSVPHGCLRGETVLLSDGGEVKLAGLSMGRGLKDSKSETRWASPEVLAEGEGGVPADIWGLGCLATEMATGNVPWAEYRREEEVAMMVMGSEVFPALPSACSPQFVDFVHMCLRRGPSDRPSVWHLSKHPFLRL